MKRLLKNFAKHKILFLFFLCAFFITLSHTVKAYVDPGGGGSGTTGSSKYQQNWEKAVYKTEEMNQQSFTNETFMALTASISDKILGCGSECPDGAQANGAVQGIGKLAGNLYSNPPASTGEYLAFLGRKMGVSPVYAQGIGFDGLKTTILPVWKIFRDLSYVLFVIVFVFIGFTIMFRSKINPQTVISVQTALPRIVVALLLVTFSYAIAGLLIDLIYVLIFFIITLFQGSLDPRFVENAQVNRSIFNIAWHLLGGWDYVGEVAEQAGELVTGLFTQISLGGIVLGFAVQTLGLAVIAIAIGYSLFKLFIILLTSYIMIILHIIFAPIMLAFEAIPGQKGFSNWIKNMLSNIIVFPATLAVLVIASMLVDLSKGNPTKTWIAPFLGTGEAATSSYVGAIISIGMVLVIPQLIESIKKAIGAAGLGEAAGGIMAPLKYGYSVPAGVVGGAYNRVTRQERMYQEALAKEQASREMTARLGKR